MAKQSKMVRRHGGQTVSYNPGMHGGKRRKHTPIVSEAQRGLFGAVRGGQATKATGLTKKLAGEHLREAAGKKLPARKRRRA